MEEWINKNKSEKIKISISEFKDKKSIDIRIFYFDADSDEYKPTRKGVNIPIDKKEEFIEKLNRILEEE